MSLLEAPEGIRDVDLLERVRGADPFALTYVTRDCQREQERRDQLLLLPRDKRRRAVVRHVLEGEGAERDDLRHIHSALAICSLPYKRQPLETRSWERNQGRMSLLVQAGKLRSPENGRWVDQPLPYGSRARLLLLHTCSEAIRQKSATIEIADSLTGFIREMGFQATGGKNGTIDAFKQQVQALAACTMRIGLWDGDHARTVSTQPFSEIDVWFPASADQKMLWPSTVTFSQDFYTTLTKHALPVNLHAVRVFAGSARKLDLLFWLGYRLTSIAKPVSIPWQALQLQWGQGYTRADNFRRDFAKEIGEIKEVFPKLPVALSETGFTVSPGSHEVIALPRPPPKKPKGGG
jgi:hypothetical protein